MANLGNILQTLAGIPQGYQAQAINALKMKQLQRGENADQDFGNALSTIFAPQSVPPAPQPVAMPGAAPMPQMGPGAPGAPPAPPPGTQSLPMKPPVPGGGGMPMPPPGQNMAPPQGQPLPQPQQPQQLPQQLTWQGIVQAVKQKNPKIDGTTLAEVVNRFTPLMASQSKAEWQQIQMQMKQQQLESKNAQNQSANDLKQQQLDLKEKYDQQMESIRDKLANIAQQRADTGDTRADTGNKKLDEQTRHDKATEQNQSNKANKPKALTGTQQKRSEAIDNTIAQTDELIDLVKKYPNAVGTSGNLARRRTGVTSMLGAGLSDEEQAAQRIQELNKELQNGLPTVEKYTTVGGGKASDFSNLDVSNWTQGAGALLPRLQQLRSNLGNVKKTFNSTTGASSGGSGAAASNNSGSKEDFSNLWQ